MTVSAFELPRPRRLLASVAAAQELHPYAIDGTVLLTERVLADAAALWKRLAAQGLAYVAAAVRALSNVEVRILVATAAPRLGDPRALSVLARVFAEHRLEGKGQLAWQAFLASDGDASFRPAATEFVAQHPARRLWPELLRAEQPSLRAAEIYLGQRGRTFDAWVRADDAGLTDAERFVRRVVLRLLTPPLLVAVDGREADTMIDQWAATAIPSEKREAWYQLYLEETRQAQRRPEHAVLTTVLDRFGEPASARPFWAGVSDDARRAFERWLKDRYLTSQLGEGERVQFWRRYLDRMTRSTTNKHKDVVFLHFPGWFAMQFVNTGTATFMFREHLLRGLQWMEEADLARWARAHWHEGESDAERRTFLGRYEHRGIYWQYSAAAEVDRVLAFMQQRNA